MVRAAQSLRLFTCGAGFLTATTNSRLPGNFHQRHMLQSWSYASLQNAAVEHDVVRALAHLALVHEIVVAVQEPDFLAVPWSADPPPLKDLRLFFLAVAWRRCKRGSAEPAR